MPIRSASDLRAQQHAECAYVLFIEGIDVAFVTEHGNGILLGSGALTWMGRSQQQILDDNASSIEAAVTRTLKPGLELPSQLKIGEVSLDDGQLRKTTAAFQITDLDGTVAALFAVEGKDFHILGQSIDPTDDPVATSYLSAEEADVTINPRGRFINLERIGASGERRCCPPFPFNMVGMDHPYLPGDDEIIESLQVSDDPLIFEGRICTLYRIHRDTTTNETGASEWTRWKDAHDAGDLVWWGTLRDVGGTSPGGVLTLNCFGPDALLSKKLGTQLTSETFSLEGVGLALEGVEQSVSVIWISNTNNTVHVGQHKFHSSINNNFLDDTYQTKAELKAALNAILTDSYNNNTALGTSGNNIAGDSPYNVAANSDPYYITARFLDTGGIRCTAQWGAEIEIILHEKVWRFLGFDLPVHSDDDPYPASYSRDHSNPISPAPNGTIGFRRYADGAGIHLTGETTEGPGYRGGRFYTWEWFNVSPSGAEFFNNGFPKEFEPANKVGGVSTLKASARQTITIPGGTSVQPQKMFAASQAALDEMGQSALQGRQVVIAGKIKTIDNGEEREDTIYQVGTVSFNEITLQSGVRQELYLERWADPQAYGFDNERRYADWLLSEESGIELRFLNSYAYNNGQQAKFENALTTFLIVLCSTGTATGWNGPIEDVPTLVQGTNKFTTTFLGVTFDVISDLEIADLGLGIPINILAPFEQFKNAFDTVPGGYDGALSRGRFASFGGFDSSEFFDWIMKPRRLMWRLHGKRYGIMQNAEPNVDDVDISIGEQDLYGRVGDPTSVIPNQQNIVSSTFDKVKLDYAKNAWDGNFEESLEHFARDKSARFRSGVREIPLADAFLVPSEYYRRTDGIKRFRELAGGDWKTDFYRWWTIEVAKFLASPHYEVEVMVNRVKGQDIMPGTTVQFSSPWVYGRDGTQGVTNLIGVATAVTFDSKRHAYKCRFTLYGNAANKRYWAPIAMVRGISGSTIFLENNWLGIRLPAGSYVDASAFFEPSWSEIGVQGSVYVFDEDGNTTSHYQVASVDTVNNTITVSGGPITEMLRDKHKWVVFSPYVDQPVGAWTRAFLQVVTDGSTFNGGANTGFRLL